MQRLGNTGLNLVTRQLQISGQADAECSLGASPKIYLLNQSHSLNIFPEPKGSKLEKSIDFD